MLLFALQFFIFELGQYKVKIDSDNLEEYNRRFRRMRLLKYFMLSISFITSFAKMYIEYRVPEPFKNNIYDFN